MQELNLEVKVVKGEGDTRTKVAVLGETREKKIYELISTEKPYE